MVARPTARGFGIATAISNRNAAGTGGRIWAEASCLEDIAAGRFPIRIPNRARGRGGEVASPQHTGTKPCERTPLPRLPAHLSAVP
jgi:hypothetical protein